ncbi:hypothetical protein [Pseudomonas mediterranea]|uniref:hypothetical protein n=1 Tax=Pseudomonas mediterranea TaxID=183795 RepID=UPI0006D8A572|nr:hypothetical protein [Pseudomonas mediterranea]
MIIPAWAKIAAPILAFVMWTAASAGTAWHFRGVKADRDLLQYQQNLEDEARLERERVDLKRQADAKNLSDSSARLDTVEKAQQVEVQYVDREVIKYRDRPVAGKCTLPAEWVRLYNQSGRSADKLPSAPNP